MDRQEGKSLGISHFSTARSRGSKATGVLGLPTSLVSPRLSLHFLPVLPGVILAPWGQDGATAF